MTNECIRIGQDSEQQKERNQFLYAAAELKCHLQLNQIAHKIRFVIVTVSVFG